jgi:hypothetical protein
MLLLLLMRAAECKSGMEGAMLTSVGNTRSISEAWSVGVPTVREAAALAGVFAAGDEDEEGELGGSVQSFMVVAVAVMRMVPVQALLWSEKGCFGCSQIYETAWISNNNIGNNSNKHSWIPWNSFSLDRCESINDNMTPSTTSAWDKWASTGIVSCLFVMQWGTQVHLLS